MKTAQMPFLSSDLHGPHLAHRMNQIPLVKCEGHQHSFLGVNQVAVDVFSPIGG
jgi:hypothetical protein